MSRDIKFRAWDSITKVMYLNTLPIPYGMQLIGEYSGVVGIPVNDIYSHMQYTGLKDKNGVEIYEGDLLRNTKHQGQVVEVYWHGCEVKEDNWIHFQGWKFRKSESDTRMTYAIYQHAVEVIGNIYENPELLKESKSE